MDGVTGGVRKYAGLFGYAGGTCHVWAGHDGGGIASTDEAKEYAREHDLDSFFLGAAGNLHTGYLRNPERKGGYERRPRREAVLLNLSNPGPYSLADYHRWKRLLKRFGGWEGVFEALEEERGDR
jgi:hypothetical protein